MTPDGTPDHQLHQFLEGGVAGGRLLTAARARLRPEDIGIRPAGNRRGAGLHQSDLAWYVRRHPASALAGLVLTTAIVGLGDMAGMDPRLAKLAAIAASFVLTWVLRVRVVFRCTA